MASKRSCKGTIALGEFKIKSPRGLLPTLGERFLCDWFGTVCERWRVDHATDAAPKSGLRYKVIGAAREQRIGYLEIPARAFRFQLRAHASVFDAEPELA